MTTINTMSAADEIAARISSMSAFEKRALLDALNQKVAAEADAADVKESQRKRIDSLRAARAKAQTDLAAANELSYLAGTLTRHGLPDLQTFAEQGPAAIDRLLASATRPLDLQTRLEVKGRLHRLGLA